MNYLLWYAVMCWIVAGLWLIFSREGIKDMGAVERVWLAILAPVFPVFLLTALVAWALS